MNDSMLKRILAPLASLRLTVVLLALSMALVYAGTWAQVDTGIWQVQKQYFYSFFTWINFQTLLPRPQPGQPGIPGGFPFPGGYTIGGLLLVNLLAAYALRFRFAWKRSGVLLIHLGLLMLLVGGLLTWLLSTESRMTIEEGQSVDYSVNHQQVELAVIDPSPANHDNVAAIPGSRLRSSQVIHHSGLPFDIRVDRLYRNSAIAGPHQAGALADARATAGDGVGLTALEQPQAAATRSEIDWPSAYVTLVAHDGKPLGTYLLSTYPVLDQPQAVRVDGREYFITLRFERIYKPYTLHLIKFSFDRYTGTEVARNYSSLVRLVDPSRGEDRELRIWMNHPLRYRGDTIYQADFNHQTEKGTVLQVVSNPNWFLPYIACVIGTLGLVIHFGAYLVNFIRHGKVAARAAKAKAGQRSLAETLVPAAAAGICLIYLLSLVLPPREQGAYDLAAFGRLPISFDGRVQPLDSVARNSLKAISARQGLQADGQTLPANQWLIDLFTNPQKARQHRIIRIDYPDILGLLGLNPDQKLYSVAELEPGMAKLEEQFQQAARVDERQRDAYQRKIIELGNKVNLYYRLSHWLEMHLAPPTAAGEHWQTASAAIETSQKTGQINPGLQHLGMVLGAYGDGKPQEFSHEVAAYQAYLWKIMPDVVERADFEAWFNRADPFYACMLLYVLAFVLAACSWLGWSRPLARAAFWVLVMALAVHTLGIIGRIYISGRPPVTNLASSAIFVGWGAVALAAGMERFFRNSLGSAMGAAIGAISLVVYYNLAMEGDTMRVLVAVLDTNIWLATHVVAITLGYSTMFLAGFLGILYILRGVFTRSLTRPAAGDLARMIYGVTCFAMLFSFVGTVLGGIWADQSWGRFWGWDTKENGAVLVVLWCALMLHSRWGGLVGQRGLAMLAIGGNIITSWSWFGTNMLGVGLHSYGFMDSALRWLLLFDVSQLMLIALGGLPLDAWRSGIKQWPAASGEEATEAPSHAGTEEQRHSPLPK